MKRLALLINEQAVRERVTDTLGDGVSVDTFPTAAKALTGLTATRYDLIVMDWKVYPGFGADDEVLRELATTLPNIRHNENLLYWQVILRVLELLREEDASNRSTPVVLRLPHLFDYRFGMELEDPLTLDAVRDDLRGKEPVDALYGVPLAEFIDAIRRAAA